MDALPPSAAEVRMGCRGRTRRSAGRAAGSPCAVWSGWSASGSAVSSSGGAGSHLGPGLRAAHGQGIPGLWTAQQQNGGGWSGEFVSSFGAVTLPKVSYAGSLSAVQPGMVVPALDAGAGDEVYPLTGSGKWVRGLIGVVGGTPGAARAARPGVLRGPSSQARPARGLPRSGGGVGRLPQARRRRPAAGRREGGGTRRSPGRARSPCSRSSSG